MIVSCKKCNKKGELLVSNPGDIIYCKDCWYFIQKEKFYSEQGCPESVVKDIINTKSKLMRHRKFLLWRDRVCKHCGYDKNLTVDHIIPRSITKQTKKSNLKNKQILCGRCNSEKGNKI